MKKFYCPVCGFDKQFENFDIRPCCGTQFGYHDRCTTHIELGMRWIKSGANWWSEVNKPPIGWNPIQQLINRDRNEVVPEDPPCHDEP